VRAACGILVSVLALSTVPAWAQDRPTYASLWATATQTSGCASPAGYADFILVPCLAELTLWYFTKPNHPAHPGVIKRTVVQENGGAWIAREHGYSFAPDEAQPAFKHWLAEIADLDRQMREDIERRRGGDSNPNAN
jgi:hypothetical protein